MSFEIVDADLEDSAHTDGIIEILNAYAQEEVGGGEPLRADVKEQLIPALRRQSNAVVLVALTSSRLVGVAVCFAGFSTFAAQPLLNIHDLAVLPEFRGLGIGQALLEAVEERARSRGCCKLTLEVLEVNEGARRLYGRFGFGDYSPGSGKAVTYFLQKRLRGSP